MKFQHNKVFTRFCALLLAVVTSLLLCVPAFAAYGSTPTYATGNYSYNSSTSSQTSTSTADWFTAVLAQLRTMYAFTYSKLNAINTAIGFCQDYLAEVRDNTKKLIVMDTTLTSIWNKLNLDINPSISSIKNDTSSIKTLVGTSNTNTSSIYSQVLKLATEVTAAKILTAVQSISTDGLATETTLSALNSKAATESTLKSVSDALYYTYDDGTSTSTSNILNHISDISGKHYLGFVGFSETFDNDFMQRYQLFIPNRTSWTSYGYLYDSNSTKVPKWGVWQSNSRMVLLDYGLNSDGSEYDLASRKAPSAVGIIGLLFNRFDNLIAMQYRLVDQLADAEDEKLKDATEDRRTTVTDYIKSDGTNDKYADSLGLAQTVTGGLETGVTMSDANTFVDGVLNGDSDSDYWSWFTQATADDLDQASSGSSASLAPRSPAQSTYWVIDPNATADDYINDWRSGNG